MTEERLQKVLAHAGVASRRASEELIAQGRVQVNGQVVTKMGVRVNPEQDTILVNGQPIRTRPKKRYLILYKPTGVISVLYDDRERQSLIDLVPDAQGLHPVGRLDLDSEGLILLTNHGELTQRLTHPRYKHDKAYHALVRGKVNSNVLHKLRVGVQLEDGKTAPARVSRLERVHWEPAATRNQTWLKFVIHEGRKRQIRRMSQVVGLRVDRLIRIRIGPVNLSDLPSGAYRELKPHEIRNLLKVTRLEQRTRQKRQTHTPR